MCMARAAGLPVPYVVSVGEHPHTSHAHASILMTRMPGEEMFSALWEWWTPGEQEVFVSQLRDFLAAIRQWRKPIMQTAGHGTTTSTAGTKGWIGSALGTQIRSMRVPHPHSIGPCIDEDEFDDILMRPARTMRSQENHDELVEDVRIMQEGPRHDIVFTHGDLLFHNLLVLPDGRISAVLDWESSGWYPSYWEFTTMLRTFPKGFWYIEVVDKVGGAGFELERKGDRARRYLGVDAGTFGW